MVRGLWGSTVYRNDYGRSGSRNVQAVKWALFHWPDSGDGRRHRSRDGPDNWERSSTVNRIHRTGWSQQDHRANWRCWTGRMAIRNGPAGLQGRQELLDPLEMLGRQDGSVTGPTGPNRLDRSNQGPGAGPTGPTGSQDQ